MSIRYRLLRRKFPSSSKTAGQRRKASARRHPAVVTLRYRNVTFLGSSCTVYEWAHRSGPESRLTPSSAASWNPLIFGRDGGPRVSGHGIKPALGVKPPRLACGRMASSEPDS